MASKKTTSKAKTARAKAETAEAEPTAAEDKPEVAKVRRVNEGAGVVHQTIDHEGNVINEW